MRAGSVIAIAIMIVAANLTRLHLSRGGFPISDAGHVPHSHSHSHSHGHWHGDVYHVHEHSHSADAVQWDYEGHDTQPHDDHAHVRGVDPDQDQRSPMPEMLQQRRDHQTRMVMKSLVAPVMVGTLPEPCIWRPEMPPRSRDAPVNALRRAIVSSVILQI